MQHEIEVRISPNVTVIKGNLLDTTAPYIGHQVNCLGVMGAGVAKAIRERWPEVYECYAEFCHREHEEGFQPLGEAQLVPTDDGRMVINLFGQLGVRKVPGQMVTDYESLRSALVDAVDQITQSLDAERRFALPYGIGCGLGGGDWDVVQDMICEVFKNTGIEVELWKLQ